MSATGKRVFWNDTEKTFLAQHMAAYLAAHPEASMLHAVREAQLHLPEDRRREIVTWTIVAGALQPLLLAAQESMLSKAPDSQAAVRQPETAGTAAVERPNPASAPEPLPATTFKHGGDTDDDTDDDTATRSNASGKPDQGLDSGPSLAPIQDGAQGVTPGSTSTHDTAPAEPKAASSPSGFIPSRGKPESVSLDPLQVEAALLAALTSPGVERALVDLFGRAMSQAFSRLSPGNSLTEGLDRELPPASNGRVLVAGFSASDAQLLSTALGSHFEVRVWKPMQSPQLFEALVKMCTVVVVPEEMSDDVDEAVSAMGTRLVRFQGSTARVVERVHALMSA